MQRIDVNLITIEPGFFKTGVSNREAIEKVVWKQFLQSVPEIQKESGNDFVKEQTLKNLDFMDKPTCTNYDLVMDTYLKGLLSKCPFRRYSPGIDAAYFDIPLSYLPSAL
uniref:RDH1 n=1 Tax=Rhabditophanes sp. KR3021 TaxID=114890 RepID=A0AC35UBZ8_9BILA